MVNTAVGQIKKANPILRTPCATTGRNIVQLLILEFSLRSREKSSWRLHVKCVHYWKWRADEKRRGKFYALSVSENQSKISWSSSTFFDVRMHSISSVEFSYSSCVDVYTRFSTKRINCSCIYTKQVIYETNHK